jgi:hypothetical protein
MHTVIVVDATESVKGPLLDDVVGGVLRVDDQVRRLRDLHFVAEHGDPSGTRSSGF